jgi:WD40 repeat protein/Leucine-rich repeat (LRR) protein
MLLQVDIGKDQDTLGDDGLSILVKYFPEGGKLTILSIISHDISEIGAKSLSNLFSTCINLKSLILRGNCVRNEGARSICEVLKTLLHLGCLDLSENEIDTFPTDLVHCTNLTELFIQHNKIRILPLDIGLHPHLMMLDILDNPIANVRPENTSSTKKILEELLAAKVSEACSKAAANTQQQPAVLSKHITYPLHEVDVSIPARWASSPSFIASVLSAHPALRSLNQLHEWPGPPLAPTDSWDLAGRLANPLYEAVFVANRLGAAQHLTRLDISHNDLRGPAAPALARAVATHACLAEVDAAGCTWDGGGQRAFADGAAAAPVLHRVNAAATGGLDPRWDLRGAICSIVEAEFVAARLRRCGAELAVLDLRRNDLPPAAFAAIADALPTCAALTRLDGLSAAADERTWSLRKRLLFDAGRAPGGGGGGGGNSPRRATAAPPRSSPNLAAELSFISAAAERCGELTELDLSSNCLGDAGAALVAQLVLPFARRVVALHLHQNGITGAGATALGEALVAGNHGVETLRLSENPVGGAGLAAVAAGFALRRNRRPRGFPGPRGQVVQLHFDATGVGPTLPDALFALDTLEVLSLRDNGVAALDPDLCRLTRLRALVLDGNPLVFPPPAVAAHGTAAILACLAEAGALGRARDRHLRTIRCEWRGLPEGPHSDDARAVEAAARRTIAALSVTGAGDPQSEPVSPDDDSDNPTIPSPTLAAAPALPAAAALLRDDASRALAAEHVLQRHGREVLGVCFGGGLLATCGADRSVKLWARQPAADGVQRGQWTCCDTLRGHVDAVNSIALRVEPEVFGGGGGLLLASGSADGTVRLWTLGEGAAAPVPESAAMATAAAPALLSAQAAGVAGEVLCDWQCVQVLRRVEAPDAALRGSSITAVAFSDAQAPPRLACGAADGRILIWGPVALSPTTTPTIAAASVATTEEATYEEAQLLAAHSALRQLFDKFGHGGARPATAAAATPPRRHRPALDGMSYTQLAGLCETIGLLEGLSRARLFALYRQARAASRHRSGDLDFPSFGLLLWRVCMAVRRTGPPALLQKSPLPMPPPAATESSTWAATAADPACGRAVSAGGWRCGWTPFGTVREVIAGVSVAAVETLFSPYASRRRLLGPAAAAVTAAVTGPPPPPPPWALLFALEGHEGAVLALVWLPAACKCLVTAGEDSTVRLWQYSEKRTGRGSWAPVFKGFGHEGPVLSLSCGPSQAPALSPRRITAGEDSFGTGKSGGGSAAPAAVGPAAVVSASADGTALVWDVVERRFELVGRTHIGYTLRKGCRLFPPHPNHPISSAGQLSQTVPGAVATSSVAVVSACSVRCDGQLLATADVGGGVAFWVPSGGGGWRCEERSARHVGRVANCSFGEGEHAGLLATCGDDCTVCVRDTASTWPLAVASKTTPEAVRTVRAPSRECQPFQLRRPPAYFVLIDRRAVAHALVCLVAAARAASSSTSLIGPDHGERLRLGCQLGEAARRAVRLDIAAGTVWSTTQFSAACWNADATAAAAAAANGFQFVGPLVRLWPEEALFRIPVAIHIPHHGTLMRSPQSAANRPDPGMGRSCLDQLMLVRYAGDAENGQALLEAVPGAVVRIGHADAVMSVFSGFLAVVRRLTSSFQSPVAAAAAASNLVSALAYAGNTPTYSVSSPAKQVPVQEDGKNGGQGGLKNIDEAYCLILQPDGAPLSRVVLAQGNWFRCLAEIIPAAHFAPALALAPPFWPAITSAPTLRITRGAALSNIRAILSAPLTTICFAMEAKSSSQQRWEGKYAVVEFRLRISPVGGTPSSPLNQHKTLLHSNYGSVGTAYHAAAAALAPAVHRVSTARCITETNHLEDTQARQILAITLPIATGKSTKRSEISPKAFVGLNAGRLVGCGLPRSTLSCPPVRIVASPTPAPARGRGVVLKFALELEFATIGGNIRCESEEMPARLGPFEMDVQPI